MKEILCTACDTLVTCLPVHYGGFIFCSMPCADTIDVPIPA